MKRPSGDNIHVLDNSYAREQYAKYSYEQKQVIFRRRRLSALFILAVFIFTSAGIALFKDHQRLQLMRTYQVETQAKKKQTETEKSALEKEVALLKDEEYVGKLARSRYFYSKSGELIYPLPENNDSQLKEDSTNP